METDNPFEKVLDRLREKGWMKGELGEPTGPNCMVGGAHYTVGAVFLNWAIPTTIIKDQYPGRGGPHGFVDVFNDHPDTTFTDVERVLEKAAVKWEEERVMRDD